MTIKGYTSPKDEVRRTNKFKWMRNMIFERNIHHWSTARVCVENAMPNEPRPLRDPLKGLNQQNNTLMDLHETVIWLSLS